MSILPMMTSDVEAVAACTETVVLNKRPLAHTSGRVGAGQSVHTSKVCLQSDWCVHPASPPGVPSDECVL